MHPLYQELEETLQKKLTQGWEEFNKSDMYEFCKEFHNFLWNKDEYTNIHRRRLPHAPYEYAARLVGIPFMNELLKLGLYTNTWFPGYYDIRDEYPTSSTPARQHPGGRVTHLILFANNGHGSIEKFCKLSLEFALRHYDIHQAFGFQEPKLKIIETYQDHPEKFINRDLIHQPTENYHAMGTSWQF